HPYVPAPVCIGIFVLKGICLRPGIFPRIVAGRRSSRKSVVITFCGASGPAHVTSVIVPAATAAFRYNSTSGVESFHRPFAYCAASCRLPLQTNIAQAARTKAVPFGRGDLTWMTGIPPRNAEAAAAGSVVLFA